MKTKIKEYYVKAKAWFLGENKEIKLLIGGIVALVIVWKILKGIFNLIF